MSKNTNFEQYSLDLHQQRDFRPLSGRALYPALKHHVLAIRKQRPPDAKRCAMPYKCRDLRKHPDVVISQVAQVVCQGGLRIVDSLLLYSIHKREEHRKVE